MPRLTKIYTRKGDEGSTSLSGGQKVPKDSERVRAYGTVDELNAVLGVALAHGVSERLAEVLPTVQNELFHLGSDLSFLEEDKAKHDLPEIEARHIRQLEKLIDELLDVVGPLQNFILPGGTKAAADLHVARTVCRRAEREVVALARTEAIGEHAIAYLNRLSDALFVMARYENHVAGVPEPLWDSRA
ncbi:MAG: cob(I)yrinic acid a,c-diamide adenosyltransferase [Candidatus Promineifilaceae bacterium]|nr:cob(I)yrinic acid a,c-diamide adenosyltransferase [Candidatus Promineifilaceae bacterium]